MRRDTRETAGGLVRELVRSAAEEDEASGAGLELLWGLDELEGRLALEEAGETDADDGATTRRDADAGALEGNVATRGAGGGLELCSRETEAGPPSLLRSS